MTETYGRSASQLLSHPEGLYYNKGLFSEELVYHDDESIYLEHKGKESGIVRFTFEMMEGLKIVEEEKEDSSQ